METKYYWVPLEIEKEFKKMMVSDLLDDGIKKINEKSLHLCDLDSLIFVYRKRLSVDPMEVYKKNTEKSERFELSNKNRLMNYMICIIGNSSKNMYTIDITKDPLKLISSIKKKSKFNVRMYAKRNGSYSEFKKIKEKFFSYKRKNGWYKIDGEFSDFIKNNFEILDVKL